jgi:hypothetical protein
MNNMKKVTIKKDEKTSTGAKATALGGVKSKNNEFSDLISKELNAFKATAVKRDVPKSLEPIKQDKLQIGKISLNQNAIKANNDDVFRKSGNKFGVKIDMKKLGDNAKNEGVNDSRLSETQKDWNNTSKGKAYTTEKTFKDASPHGTVVINKDMLKDLDKKNVRPYGLIL